MTDIHLDEYQTRLHKRTVLLEAGVIPYADRYQSTHTIASVQAIAQSYHLPDAELLMQEGAAQTYSIAGRMMMFRTHGKLSFAQLRDGSGTIQIAFVKGLCRFFTGREVVESLAVEGQELSAYKCAEKYLDVGDFVGVKGELFMTKHGELTLFVDEFQLLAKTLRPLGDKWHGVKDEELMYRQRYLDLTMHDETYQRFLFRSAFVRALREFYRSQGFVEIETPVLGSAASGAAAQPFVTYHEDFEQAFFLRIAPEIGLKKATVGRFEKVFEIGKQFRNEGSDPSHLQEFTSVEHYAVYRNYEDNMRFTEAMFAYLFETLSLHHNVLVKDKQGVMRTIDFSAPWQKIDYVVGVKEASGGIDITTYAAEDADRLRADIRAKGHERVGMDDQGTTTLIDYLYKKVLRPTILGPAFVYNYPKLMQPLARGSDHNPCIVEQFQVVVNGREIIKAYSELVDPVVQKENFALQAQASAQGDAEATAGDDEFVLAMEHGMPPQSGRGMGIDRIITLLTQQDNLRDSILFPLMKPVHHEVDTPAHDTIGPSGVGLSACLEDKPYIAPTKSSLMSVLPTIEQVEGLIESYLTDTRRHCQQVGAVMKWFAKNLGEDEYRRWMAGVLHDIDRDHVGKDPDKHLKASFERMMDEINAPAELRDDIKSHATELTGVQVGDDLLRKYLASVDELSGFLYAYSLMRPTGFHGMEVKGVLKRMKDKTFAAGVDRTHLKNCEAFLGIPLEVFIPQMIEAMQTIGSVEKEKNAF